MMVNVNLCGKNTANAQILLAVKGMLTVFERKELE